MYYYKVPAASSFTLTAKATINSFDNNDQVSFGLMARDDMYLDTNTTNALGDYVAAGPLKLKSGAWNCFARKNGVLTQGGTCENAITNGDTVDLKIESNADGYACTFGQEATVTGGFDFKLTTIDSDYVYVGMYVARNADVTFSDVKLIVDGREVTAEPEQPSEPEQPTTPAEPTTPEQPTTPAESTKPEAAYVDITVEGVAAATIGPDAVVKTVDGTVLTADQIKLILTTVTENEQQLAIKNKLESQAMALKANNAYYHIGLTDMAGNAVELVQGTIRFLLAFPDGTGDQDSFVVYHVKDNGEIENMPVQLSANGIVIETTGFSDFVVSYDIVRSADTTHNTDTDDVKTADMAQTLPYTVMLLAAFGCFGLVVTSKKRHAK